jgi:uncharacterized protein (DUF1330 family)
MPAYVIVETDVHDAEQYERCKAASPGAIASWPSRVCRHAASDGSSLAP